MRRISALFAAAGALVGVVATRRSVRARVARWDTNPDRCEGDPLGLPAGTTEIEVVADDGARLRGHRVGDPAGPTVLLVHGYVESVRSWAPVVRRLTDAGLDVVVIDQRGHGDSERGPAPFDCDTLASDLGCWVEQLGLHDAVLAGHSMGGVGAMAFAGTRAELAADRLRSLVLVATCASSDPLRLPPVPADLTRPLRLFERVLAVETVGLLCLARVFGAYPTRGALEATRDGLLATDLRTRVDAAHLLRDFDLRPLLPAVAVPVVVVAGTHDRLTPLWRNEAIADLVPDGRLEVLPGMGHMLMFEAPDAVTDAIVQATKPKDA